MKKITEKMESYIKFAEDKLKDTKGISGMTLFHLKKENYIILTKEHYNELISIFEKISNK